MISKNYFDDPLSGRKEKPRNVGQTMVLDKGLGMNNITDLLSCGGEYIDYVKFTFATALLYPESILRRKVLFIRENEIEVYTGGTFFEIAVFQNKLREYLQWLKSMNFTAVEISDGTIELSKEKRKKAIEMAKDMGFVVLTEVGKKDKKKSLNVDEIIDLINFDLDSGADKVIIEARESGKNISIFKENGDPKLNSFELIKNKFNDKLNKIIWEAPLKKQQLFFINSIGNNVNLGNIATTDVIALEGLRRGLRGDTFAEILKDEKNT